MSFVSNLPQNSVLPHSIISGNSPPPNSTVPIDSTPLSSPDSNFAPANLTHDSPSSTMGNNISFSIHNLSLQSGASLNGNINGNLHPAITINEVKSNELNLPNSTGQLTQTATLKSPMSFSSEILRHSQGSSVANTDPIESGASPLDSGNEEDEITNSFTTAQNSKRKRKPRIIGQNPIMTQTKLTQFSKSSKRRKSVIPTDYNVLPQEDLTMNDPQPNNSITPTIDENEKMDESDGYESDTHENIPEAQTVPDPTGPIQSTLPSPNNLSNPENTKIPMPFKDLAEFQKAQKLKIYPATGDGNCLFNSVSTAIYGIASSNGNLRSSTQTLMKHWLANPDSFTPANLPPIITLTAKQGQQTHTELIKDLLKTELPSKSSTSMSIVAALAITIKRKINVLTHIDNPTSQYLIDITILNSRYNIINKNRTPFNHKNVLVSFDSFEPTQNNTKTVEEPIWLLFSGRHFEPMLTPAQILKVTEATASRKASTEKIKLLKAAKAAEPSAEPVVDSRLRPTPPQTQNPVPQPNPIGPEKPMKPDQTQLQIQRDKFIQSTQAEQLEATTRGITIDIDSVAKLGSINSVLTPLASTKYGFSPNKIYSLVRKILSFTLLGFHPGTANNDKAHAQLDELLPLPKSTESSIKARVTLSSASCKITVIYPSSAERDLALKTGQKLLDDRPLIAVTHCKNITIKNYRQFHVDYVQLKLYPTPTNIPVDSDPAEHFHSIGFAGLMDWKKEGLLVKGILITCSPEDQHRLAYYSLNANRPPEIEPFRINQYKKPGTGPCFTCNSITHLRVNCPKKDDRQSHYKVCGRCSGNHLTPSCSYPKGQFRCDWCQKNGVKFNTHARAKCPYLQSEMEIDLEPLARKFAQALEAKPKPSNEDMAIEESQQNRPKIPQITVDWGSKWSRAKPLAKIIQQKSANQNPPGGKSPSNNSSDNQPEQSRQPKEPNSPNSPNSPNPPIEGRPHHQTQIDSETLIQIFGKIMEESNARNLQQTQQLFQTVMVGMTKMMETFMVNMTNQMTKALQSVVAPTTRDPYEHHVRYEQPTTIMETDDSSPGHLQPPKETIKERLKTQSNWAKNPYYSTNDEWVKNNINSLNPANKNKKYKNDIERQMRLYCDKKGLKWEIQIDELEEEKAKKRIHIIDSQTILNATTVVASIDLTKGKPICQYGGIFINTEDFSLEDFQEKQYITINTAFAFTSLEGMIGHMIIGDPTTLGPTILHAKEKDANCRFNTTEENTLEIVAKRNIKAGEELLVNYGNEYWDNHEPLCPICFWAGSKTTNPMLLCDGVRQINGQSIACLHHIHQNCIRSDCIIEADQPFYCGKCVEFIESQHTTRRL